MGPSQRVDRHPRLVVAYSELASPYATRAVLERHGLATKKRLSQHFLVDDNIIGRIMELADLGGDEVVLEVGPGIGTLTVALCRRAGSVVAIERDVDLLPVLRETTVQCPRLAVIAGDALVVSAEEIAAPFGEPCAVVANLPYSVAATIVLHLFETLPGIAVRSRDGAVRSSGPDRCLARDEGLRLVHREVALAC